MGGKRSCGVAEICLRPEFRCATNLVGRIESTEKSQRLIQKRYGRLVMRRWSDSSRLPIASQALSPAIHHQPLCHLAVARAQHLRHEPSGGPSRDFDVFQPKRQFIQCHADGWLLSGGVEGRSQNLGHA